MFLSVLFVFESCSFVHFRYKIDQVHNPFPLYILLKRSGDVKRNDAISIENSVPIDGQAHDFSLLKVRESQKKK